MNKKKVSILSMVTTFVVAICLIFGNSIKDTCIRYVQKYSGDNETTAIDTINVSIDKKAKWTDAENAVGEITLKAKANYSGQVDESPIDVAIILDKSGSMKTNWLIGMTDFSGATSSACLNPKHYYKVRDTGEILRFPEISEDVSVAKYSHFDENGNCLDRVLTGSELAQIADTENEFSEKAVKRLTDYYADTNITLLTDKSKGCTERLELVQNSLSNLINKMYEKYPNSRISLAGFSFALQDGTTKVENCTWDNNDANVVTDFLTVDKKDVLIEKLKNRSCGNATNYTAGLEYAVNLIKNRPESEKNRRTVVLFLSDGVPNAGDGVDAATELATLGVDVYGIGINIPATSEQYIKNIASKDKSGDLLYYNIKNVSDFDDVIQNVYENFSNALATDVVYQDVVNSKYFDILPGQDLGDDVSVNGNKLTWNIGELGTNNVTKSFKIKLKEEYRFSDVNNLSMLTNSDTEVSKGANLEYKKVSKVNGKSVNYTSDSKISIESPRLIYNYKGGNVNFEVSEVTGKDDTVYFGIFNDQNQNNTSLIKKLDFNLGNSVSFDNLSKSQKYYIYEVDESGSKIKSKSQYVLDTKIGNIKEIENGFEFSNTMTSVITNTDDAFRPSNVSDDILTVKNLESKVSLKQNLKDITVNKVWIDNKNETHIRPSNITILIKNGNNLALKKEFAVTNENQSYQISNLRKYDSNGNEIQYTIEEEQVPGYSTSINGNTITNTIKKLKITTEVEGVGGSISGNGLQPYEEVLYGAGSTKDILIVPEDKYQIKKITINGMEQVLPTKVDEKYLLSKFENIIEDVHVVVSFDKADTKVIVNYKEIGSNNKLLDEITINGKVDDVYKTINKLDEINKKYNDKYEYVKVDGNVEGNITKETIYVTYWYDKKQGEVEVKYIDKDTNIELLQSEILTGKVDSKYTTNDKISNINSKYDDKYELVAVPENASGNYTLEKQTVIYYYSKKQTKVVTKYIDFESGEEIYNKDIIYGKIDDEYKTENKIDKINEKFDEKYELVKVDGDISGNMTQETSYVVYYYQKKKGIVEVLYKEIGTNNELASKETFIDILGKNYITRDKIEEINDKNNEKYQFVKIDGSNIGVFDEDTKSVIYWYEKKSTKVIVKYIDIETDSELISNVIINGKIDDEYKTENRISEINKKFKDCTYELVKIIGDIGGTMTENDIIVKYYYKKVPELVNDLTNGTPSTGNSYNVALWVVAMSIGVIGIIRTIKLLKKDK